MGEINGRLRTVWDGGKAVKYFDEDGAPMRKCLHGCGKSWKGHNHTKMLYHYLGGYQDVAPCQFVSAAWLAKYKEIMNHKNSNKVKKLEHKASLHMQLDDIDAKTSAALGMSGTPGVSGSVMSQSCPPSVTDLSVLTVDSSVQMMPPPPNGTSNAVAAFF